MSSSKSVAAARREAHRQHRNLAEDIRRLREDADVSGTQLAGAAGVDLAYLCRIEDGNERPSIETYARLANALGADLSARLYPNTGPAIRDRHQARILEHVISSLDRRWKPYPEVAVRHPSRGWIDLVVHSEADGSVVDIEIQSDLRRIEQQIRWFAAKTAALPSWEGWTHLGDIAGTSRVLIVRATRTTRTVGREFARQLEAAYPADPEDAIGGLTSNVPWPGSALVWVELTPDRVRFIRRR